MNVEALRKLQGFLQEEPRRFSMKDGLAVFHSTDYVSESDFVRDYKLLEMPPCKTAACLAGEAVMMEEKLPVKYAIGWTAVYERARKILDLNGDQCERLFYFDDLENTKHRLSDKPFAKRYKVARTPEGRVDVAVKFIDHFIKTEQQKAKRGRA